jgi:hypothetical protein
MVLRFSRSRSLHIQAVAKWLFLATREENKLSEDIFFVTGNVHFLSQKLKLKFQLQVWNRKIYGRTGKK